MALIARVQSPNKQVKFPLRVASTMTRADEIAKDTLKRFPKTIATLAE
jgi:hypothetical protein